MDVAQRHQDELPSIKKQVKIAYEEFKPNYDRFNEFRKFVYECSLKDDEINLLMTMSKPQLEFNVLEAYLSRLLGEFSKQEPDIMVSSDDQNNSDPVIINLLEQHLRHVFADTKNHNTRYEVYKDLLSGGFSVLKVTTDYAHPMSMDQVINIERVFDPTLCGFDHISKYAHKGDGRFAFELFPKERSDFIAEYPDIKIEQVSFRRDFSGFNWSYAEGNTEVLIIADYYKKKKKEVKILRLSDDRVMTVKKYEEMASKWTDFSQIPQPVGKTRKTIIENIVRYRCIDNKVIEYEETDFSHLPLIFVDGNSIMIRSLKNSNVRQVTRPYVYHAKGAQRLKNYAGISLANEVENIVQHKFIIKKEALPKEQEWLDAITNIQKPSNVVVNAFFEQNPDQPIPDPIREIIKTPAPPEVLNSFTGADSLIQNVLGSYDAALGINNNQLSGIALVEAASQSNATAMPYIVGCLQGFSRAAEIYVDLFPKYVTTPRTIPIMDEEGKKSYIKVNGKDGLSMFYDSNPLNVTVKAGASFQVQKSRTIMMVKELMGMSELFAKFIAEKGLPFVLDNMEGRGVDQLKSMVDEWLEELKKEKEMAMQQQQQEMQNNPLVMKNKIEVMKMQQKGQSEQAQIALDLQKLKQDEARILADLQKTREQSAVQLVKAETERFSRQVDLALKHKSIDHTHLKEAVELHHKVTSSKKPANESYANKETA